MAPHLPPNFAQGVDRSVGHGATTALNHTVVQVYPQGPDGAVESLRRLLAENRRF